MARYLFLLALVFSLIACEKDYDIQDLPPIGIYDAHLVGESGPFSISVSHYDDDVLIIDAPLDGVDWYTAELYVHCHNPGYCDFDIPRQNLTPYMTIKGVGVYIEGTLQLDYVLEVDHSQYEYTLIGTKI